LPTRRHTLLEEVFAKSNGIIAKVGDTSHPNGVEIILCYPDWAERNEKMLNEIRCLMHDVFYRKDYLRKTDYVI